MLFRRVSSEFREDFMQLCLCSSTDCCQLMHKNACWSHTLMAKITPLAVKCFYTREVFRCSWLCHVGVAWEGSTNQVGSQGRKGREVLQEQVRYQRDIW